MYHISALFSFHILHIFSRFLVFIVSARILPVQFAGVYMRSYALCQAQPRITPISFGRFFGTFRTFSSPATNIRAVLRLVIIRHNIGISFFSSSVRFVFPHSVFYLRAQLGALMAVFLHFPISYISRSQIIAFCVGGQSTRTLPFRLATLVCRSVRCGYLTPSLITPK